MEKNKKKGKGMNLARFGLDQYVTMSPTQTYPNLRVKATRSGDDMMPKITSPAIVKRILSQVVV